jgi:hypothetical protein
MGPSRVSDVKFEPFRSRKQNSAYREMTGGSPPAPKQFAALLKASLLQRDLNVYRNSWIAFPGCALTDGRDQMYVIGSRS